MKYASAVFLFSALLSTVSSIPLADPISLDTAVHYINGQDVNPEVNYVLTMEKDNKTYALESNAENTTAGREIDPLHLRLDTAIRWSFPNSIPVRSEEIAESQVSGYIISAATQKYLGLVGASGMYSTELNATNTFPLGYAVAELDGSITVQIYGAYVGYDGNGVYLERDDPAVPKWKLIQSPGITEVLERVISTPGL